MDSPLLSDTQRFIDEGFVARLPALPEADVRRFRGCYETFEARLQDLRKNIRWQSNLHLHFGWAYDLATVPGVLDAVEEHLGPDLLILSTLMFSKWPGDPGFVSWHQDGRYLDTDAKMPPALTAWIALSESTPRSGCLRIIPGSHRDGMQEHNPTYAANNMLRRGETITAAIEEDRAVDLALAPGEMSLHHVHSLHASGQNSGVDKRIGFAIRYIHPSIGLKISNFPAVLVRGNDRYGHYQLLQQRPSDDLEEGMQNLAATVNRFPD